MPMKVTLELPVPFVTTDVNTKDFGIRSSSIINIFAFSHPSTMRSLNVVLLGSPGCGKGTLAKMLLKDYSLHLVTSSELLNSKTDYKIGATGKTVGDIMKAGGLVPDEIIFELMQLKLSKLGKTNILLVDLNILYLHILYFNNDECDRMDSQEHVLKQLDLMISSISIMHTSFKFLSRLSLIVSVVVGYILRVEEPILMTSIRPRLTASMMSLESRWK
jgi:hypothetical protein